MNIFSIVGKIAVNCSDAVKDIDKVSKSAKDAAEGLGDVDKEADKTGESVKGAGRSAKDADSGFSTWKATLAQLAANVITKAATGCANLAKSVVDLGKDFSSVMSEVQSISGASDEDMKRLEATARQFGATTIFSATNAAEALKYMSLAGWSVDESIAALEGVLNLAAASGMELGKASDMVTDYLSAFGMEADQASYFADMLSYAQSNSNTTAEQLGEAYRNCAANLHAAGQDVETVTSLLEAMANQGYKGSEAGTALAAIMRDITNAMDDGKIEIGDTTVAVMDANGNFRDLTDILTDVQNATNGMGDAQRAAALSSTFTADSTKGLNLIMNEGMENIAGYEEALRNSKDTAMNMAAVMNDNLAGDLANLNSAFEELKLKIYDSAEGPLRSLAQYTTNKVIPAVTNLVENMDTVAPVVAGVATALGVLKAEMAITGLIKSASKSWQLYKATTEGATIAQWALNEAQLASPALIIIALIAGLVVAFVGLRKTNEDFGNNVIGIWNQIRDKISSFVDNVKERFADLNITFEDIVNTLKVIWNGFCEILAPIFEGAFATLADVITTVCDVLIGVLDTFIGLFTGNWEQCWNGIQEIFGGIWEGIKAVLTDVLETLKGVVDTFLEWLGTDLDTVWSDITSTIESVWNGIIDFFISAWDGIKNVFESAVNAISDFMSSAWETIKNVVQVGIMFVAEIISAAVQIITIPWMFIWENCKTYIISAWEAIKSAVSSALDAISNVISTVWNAIVAFLSPILESIKSAISTAWNGIKTVTSTVWNAIKSVVSTILDAIKSVISSVLNAAKSVVSSVLNAIKSVFQSIWESIKSVVTNAINGVKSSISSGMNSAKSTVSSVLDAIKSKFTSIWDTCKSVVSNAISHIKSVMNFSWSLPKLKLPHFSIDGSFSLNPPSVPHFNVDWYKKAMDDGMIMNQPTVFGYNPKTNSFLAGGEAGSETVVGTESLMNMINAAVQDSDNDSESAEVLKMIYAWMKNGGLRELMIDVLTNYVEFDVEGREVARLVRKYA